MAGSNSTVTELGPSSFDSPTSYAESLARFLRTDERAQPFVGYPPPSLDHEIGARLQQSGIVPRTGTL